MNRKQFLKYSGLSGLVVLTGGTGSILTACGDNPTQPAAATTVTTNSPNASPVPLTKPGGQFFDPSDLNSFTTPLNLPGSEGALAVFDVTGPFEIATKPASFEILKGKKAELLTYQIAQNGRTFINPILRVKKGSDFSANLTNNLKEDTTIHWHGLSLPWNMDGHPSLPVKSGASYRYSYPVQNRGGTYWYHPHPDKLTARQAYQGLASFYIVEDDDNTRLNQSLDLKFAESDLPLVIQDKVLDSAGNVVYQLDMTAQNMGLLGDNIMVNLSVNPYLEVDTRIYRLRLLNGSNARIYRLAFLRNKNNQKVNFSIIGTDGGLLDKPYPASEVFLSPGERLDVLLDLASYEVGEVVALKSLAFDPMENEGSMGGGMSGSGTDSSNSVSPTTGSGSMSGMPDMPGMDHGNMPMTAASTTAPAATNIANTSSNKLANGQEFFILKLTVKNKVSYDKTIPVTLSTLAPLNTVGATVTPVKLSQVMNMSGTAMQMQWLINDKSFKMDEFPVSVKKGSLAVWEFRNETQSMPHPMHVHGFQFQVLARQGSPAQLAALANQSQGRLPTDLGWKDTVLVWPGETVRVGIDFSTPFEGEQTFVAHCHNLEHEDSGMMFNYKVV